MERHQSQVTYHKEGQKVMLICSALGHPKPQITWSTPGDVSTVADDLGRKFREGLLDNCR